MFIKWWKNVLVVMLAAQFVLLGETVCMAAATLPELSLSASATEVKAGDKITYNVSYSNPGTVDYSGVVIDMNLLLGDGLIFYNSTLPTSTTSGSPSWTIGNLAAGATGGNFSITVGVGDNYAGDKVDSSLVLSGVSDEGTITVGSNSNAVAVVKEEETKEEETKKENETSDAEKTDSTEKTEVTKEEVQKDTSTTVTNLKADGVKNIDVKAISGGLKVEEQNINAWDSRYLIVGLVALGLILVVGIAAFFLGKKAN